jgi:hypothetical protein
VAYEEFEPLKKRDVLESFTFSSLIYYNYTQESEFINAGVKKHKKYVSETLNTILSSVFIVFSSNMFYHISFVVLT